MHAPHSQEFSVLVDLVAAHPGALEVFREAHTESAAITLGVHPFVIDAARSYVTEHLGWAAFEAAVMQAAARPTGVAGRAHRIEPAESSEAEAFLERAEQEPVDLERVRWGPASEVAHTHGVHPYVVYRAREALERREMRQRAHDRFDR